MKRLSLFNCLFIVVIILSSRIIVPLLTMVIYNDTVVRAWVYSLIALVVSFLMAPIVKRHFRRYKSSKKQQMLYFIMGLVAFIALFYLYSNIIPNALFYITSLTTTSVVDYLAFIISMILIFPILEIYGYKALTDRIKITYAELPGLIISSLLFTLFNFLLITPFTFESLIPYLSLFFFLGLIIAYLYNQTTTLIIPLFLCTFSLLIVNIILYISYLG